MAINILNNIYKYKINEEGYCHFSFQGNDKFSDMWVEALTIKD